MSKPLSKQDIKGPDAFQSLADRVAKFLVAQKTPIISLIAAGLFVGLAYAGVGAYSNHTETKASEEIFKEAQRLDAAQSAWAQSNKDQTKKADFELQYGQVVKDLKTVILKHKSTRAAWVQSSELAAFLTSEGRNEDAVDFLRQVSTGLKDKSILYGVLYAQLGTAYSSIEKWSEALGSFETALNSAHAAPLRGEILLKMGLSHEALGQMDKAKEFYEKTRTEFAETEAGRAARNYLRWLEFKSASESPQKEG